MIGHHRLPLLCGAVAGPLFTAAYLAEGATRAHYDPLRHPVSSLALGDSGWTQSAAFLVAGLLTLAFAAGLRQCAFGPVARDAPAGGDGPAGRDGLAGPAGLAGRARTAAGRSKWGPPLVGAWAIGLLGAGTFVTDPVSGYPQGTPDRLVDTTAHGVLHDLLSFAGFIALAAACSVLARRFARSGARGWAAYSAATAVAFTAAMLLATRAFGQDEDLVAIGGLLQRVAITTAFAWQTLLAVRLLRARTADAAAAPGAAASTRESGRHPG